MKKPLELIIRNTKSTPRTAEGPSSRVAQPLASQRQIQVEFPYESIQDHEQRLRILQGNLRLLQKKYRQNLKKGFDNKIKAYRLQAVVERKLLRQAVEQAQKVQQKEQVKNNLKQNELFNKFGQEKAMLFRVQKMQKDKFVRERNRQEKRRMSLTLYQRQSTLNALNRVTHDRIREEEQHSGKKKIFFQQLRKMSQQKEVIQTKRELLDRIVKNTQKLKYLRATLQGMETEDSHPFLTIN